MASASLFTYPNNLRALKIQLARAYSPQAPDLQLAPDFIWGVTDREPEFLARFPSGRVPALLIVPSTGSSRVERTLDESNAIAYYFASEELRGGADPSDRAEVLGWMFRSESEVWPGVAQAVYDHLGLMNGPGMSPEVRRTGLDRLSRELTLLDRHLRSRTFCVGQGLTLADFSAFACLHLLFSHPPPEVDLKAERWPHLHRWYDTVYHQPRVKTVLADFDLTLGSTKSVDPDRRESPRALPVTGR